MILCSGTVDERTLPLCRRTGTFSVLPVPVARPTTNVRSQLDFGYTGRLDSPARPVKQEGLLQMWPNTGALNCLKIAALLFLSACFCQAQGSCPAGLPVTGNHCYFISANGSDSNSGTDEAHAWLHAPHMPACSNNCLALQNAKVPAGTGLIFRGGDTWHFGDGAATPYTGGAWDWNVSPYPNGTSSSPIYIGVDKNWYSGSSWNRPVLTGDNPLTPHPGVPLDYVGSCQHQIAGGNLILGLANRQYYTIDNFEMKGICEQQLNNAAYDTYVFYAAGKGMTFSNLYIHGWTHLQFNCSGTTGLCFNIFAFQSDAQGGLPQDSWNNVVIDGSDSDPQGAGACFCSAWNVSNSVIRYAGQTVVRLPHVWHDVLVDHAYFPGDGQAHGNAWESVGDATGTNAFYNNVFSNIFPNGSSGNVVFWPAPDTSTTDYLFNNVFSLVHGGGNYMDIGQSGSPRGDFVYFNNTFENEDGLPIFWCNYLSGGTLTDINNHFITDASSPYSSPCNNKTSHNALLMTRSAAAGAGYTASETYAYSPNSATSATVNTGLNQQNACSALTTAAASDSSLSDAALACQSDTGYGCTYNTSSHSVSCPARNSLPRPTSTAWNIGAYQYNGQTAQPSSPTGLVATVQ